jgi:hypothetical protein
MHGDITRSNYRNRGAPAGFCKVHAVQYNPPVKYAVKSWSVPLTAGALISMSAVFQFIRFWPKTRTQKCKKHVLHAHGYRERSVPPLSTPCTLSWDYFLPICRFREVAKGAVGQRKKLVLYLPGRC